MMYAFMRNKKKIDANLFQKYNNNKQKKLLKKTYPLRTLRKQSVIFGDNTIKLILIILN